MISPYELLVGLALLREHRRCLEQAEHNVLEAWSALMVRIGDLLCLIQRDDVDEIISLETITPVRGVAHWVSGLSYFRGQILNIIDLKRLYSLQDTGYTPNARILVVRGQSEWFGLRIDELIGIRHVWQDTQRIEVNTPDLKRLKEHGTQCLLMDDEPLIVLDVKRLVLDISDSSTKIHKSNNKKN